MLRRPKAVAFDIIGTVFDIEPLRRPIELLGLPSSTLDHWYAHSLRDAFALAATAEYAPFRVIMEGALEVLLAQHGITPGREDIDAVFAVMRRLPAHQGAIDAFNALRSAGVTVMALSNGARALTEGLLANAGLGTPVDLIVSVDDIRCLKPRADIYHHAAETAQIRPADLALVATHAWDVHGAGMAGLATGYVARGKPFPPYMRQPDVTGETLCDVANHFAWLDR